MSSPLPLMLTASGIVVLDAIAQGKPTGKPIVGAFIVTFGLSLAAGSAPELAHGIAVIILLTSLLTSGGRLAERAGFTGSVYPTEPSNNPTEPKPTF